MSNIDKILGELMRIDGASGAAVVDADSGMVLGMSGNPVIQPRVRRRRQLRGCASKAPHDE